MNTVKKLDVEEKTWSFTWDLVLKHPVKLRGVQIINTELDKYEYEAIIFDPIPKCNEHILRINFFEQDTLTFLELQNNIRFLTPTNRAECIFVQLDDFEIVSDTCIRFRLSRRWDPELYDFELL